MDVPGHDWMDVPGHDWMDVPGQVVHGPPRVHHGTHVHPACPDVAPAVVSVPALVSDLTCLVIQNESKLYLGPTTEP